MFYNWTKNSNKFFHVSGTTCALHLKLKVEITVKIKKTNTINNKSFFLNCKDLTIFEIRMLLKCVRLL